ncbi:hypothetical protein TSUD_270470 [Trifolium subterraneum]|uniref:Uncharacterized protein n=1 Tax=Trifolium subterraneum TaxID=3900 RepID=A0A2Z6NAT6_TRISU|nr:hypothetical protein TSUD_270470 [Trifolium subterraneum]
MTFCSEIKDCNLKHMLVKSQNKGDGPKSLADTLAKWKEYNARLESSGEAAKPTASENPESMISPDNICVDAAEDVDMKHLSLSLSVTVNHEEKEGDSMTS